MQLTQRRAGRLLPFLLIAAMLLLAFRADAVSAILRSRIDLCLTTLIPSLYGCMVLGNLLCTSGAGEALGRRLHSAAALLRMPPAVFGIFLVSQFAGYPVGAALLRQAAADHALSESDAARLSCICFGGGPAFLIGFAGRQLFGSAAAGVCMMLACILANCILAILLCPRPHKTDPLPERRICISAQILTDSVSQAMKGLAQICAAVLLFGLIQHLPALLRLPASGAAVCIRAGLPLHVLRAVCAALLDITQLTPVFRCGLPAIAVLPLAAALLSFGGVCVHLQCLALGVRGMRPEQLLGTRLLAAILAALLTAAAVPLLPKLPEHAVSAFANRAAASESGSILPAFLIFLTGFPFLLKKD